MKESKTKTHSISCPECGAAILLDETNYNQVLDQIKNQEIDRRTDLIQKQCDLRVQQLERMMEEKAIEKESRIKAEAEREKEESIAEARKHYAQLRISKDAEIANLKAALEAGARTTELAVVSAEAEKDKQINALNTRISTLEETIANKDAITISDMSRLRAQLESEKTAALMALQTEKETEAAEFRERIAALESECTVRDEMIENLKDYKMRLSTKMLGETLERHCEQAYDRNLRPVLDRASFEKDTELGEKGDYIYRETDANGNEFLSILFDMKNEDELSSKSRKKRNRDHFAKLDKDRTRRGCEYAVLVSTLEPDSDTYAAGIVCVTEYEKMIVVRPQFFLDLIYILRSVSKDKARLSNALELERAKSIDVTQFEVRLDACKKKIASNAECAERYSSDAIKTIDKVISSLEAIKEKLVTWQRQNRIAQEKAEKLTIKTLTKGNTTVTAMFEAITDPDDVTIIDVDDSDVVVTSADSDAA